MLKANNALPFVPSMTYCEVTQRHGDTVFDRDIALSMGRAAASASPSGSPWSNRTG